MKKPIYSRILVDEEQIQAAVRKMADQVRAAYADLPDLMALIILEGAKYFAKDLLARLRLPFEVEHLGASSYHGGTHSTGSVELKNTEPLREKIKGKNILLIDDIYDTGLTLSKVLDWLSRCNPRSVRTCVLLEKQIPHHKQIPIDFPGLKIEDAFVIGYGLDYQGQYRDLPFIAVLAT